MIDRAIATLRRATRAFVPCANLIVRETGEHRARLPLVQSFDHQREQCFGKQKRRKLSRRYACRDAVRASTRQNGFGNGYRIVTLRFGGRVGGRIRG